MARRSRKTQNKVIKLVRKSNQLVEAHYRFSIWEQRIFTSMLAQIKYEDEDFKKYRIYLSDVIKDHGLESSHGSYDRLKAAAIELMSKTVKFTRSIDGELFESYAHIVARLDSPLEEDRREDAKFIDMTFDPLMKPHLLSLKDTYTAYDPRNLQGLSSSYHVRIYELLKQYEKIGKRTLVIEDLKKAIGVIEEVEVGGKITYKDYMPRFSIFRTKVLLKAQEKIQENTDISFTFKPKKKGRSYYSIEFTITRNSTTRVEPEPTGSTPDSKTIDLHSTIQNHVGLDQLTAWVQEFGFNQTQDVVRYTLHQLSSGTAIANVPGYIASIIRQGGLFEAPTPPQDDTPTNKNVEQRKILQAQYEQVRNQVKSEQLTLIFAHLNAHADLVEEVVEIMKKQPFARYDSSASFKENYNTNGFFRASLLLRFEKHHPDVIASVNTSGLERLKNKLDGL